MPAELKVVKALGYEIRELSFRAMMPVMDRANEEGFKMGEEIAKAAVFEEGATEPLGDALFDLSFGVTTKLMNIAIETNSVSEEAQKEKS